MNKGTAANFYRRWTRFSFFSATPEPAVILGWGVETGREQLNTVLAAVGDGRTINTYDCSWILTCLLYYHTKLLLIIQLIAK